MASGAVEATQPIGRPQWRYLYLSGLLISLVVVRPFLPVSFLSNVFNAVVVISAWLAGPSRRFSRWLLCVFTALAAISLGVKLLAPGARDAFFRGSLTMSTALLTVFFLAFCASVLLAALLRTRHVMADDILGAINLYLILGFAWAQFYTLLEIHAPGSFRLPVEFGTVSPGAYYEMAASKFVYFSFITLATQGYGDITPLTESAETLVILETTVGQLYVALVVAYLLSVHVTQRLSKP